jgi:hypothetical protein
MRHLVSQVEIKLGSKVIMLNSISLTFSFICMEMNNQDLKELIDYGQGSTIGVEVPIKIICEDKSLLVHEKSYRTRVVGIYRRSIKRIESKFVFLDLSKAQKEELRGTLASSPTL